MAEDTKPVAQTRRDQILDTAAEVFLRYGFKKTSMDDLARAVGVSRQGLYLHFQTKEAAFQAAVLRLVEQTRARHQAALQRDDLEVEERLLGAFDAMHGSVIASPFGEHLEELLAAAASLVGPRVQELETHFVADVASILTKSGVAAHWKREGVSAKELAEMLYATSCGLKYSVKVRTVYRARMRTALKIVGAGAKW